MENLAATLNASAFVQEPSEINWKHRIPKHDMVDFLDVFDFGPTVIGTCTDNFFEIRVLGELFRDMIDAKIKNLEFLLALSVDNGIRRLRSGPFKCIDGCRNPLSVIG